MEKVDTIKQLWFAEAIQNYINSTTDTLLPDEIGDFKAIYEKIKDASHLLKVQNPSNGDEPCIITLIDVEEMKYSEDVGRVLISAPRITTMERNGRDFAFTNESDTHTVIDIDVVDLRICSKKDAMLLYKMFFSIEKAVENGISWLLW